MRLREANPAQLYDRHDRACAKLARIARGDTIHGGARAMVLAKRLEAMHTAIRDHSGVPAMEIVSDVYSASNYSCGEWGAYECPECGSVHLGTSAALQCCAESEGE
jgi:hypothetical protein